MPADREDRLFEAYRRASTRDALADLLKSHQDRVYNICFHVLRHPEDAEDVAQSVLLEAIRGLHSIESARHFKAWLYRVSLHSSLKQKRARTRRVELVRKLANGPPSGGAAMDSEERAALLVAIDGLDDDTRCLVFEYYFDKSTLEEIAERQGVSAPAVWKRLEQARERIKRVLVGAGFLVTGPGLAQGLESFTPVAAPADLTTKTLVSKAVVAAAGGALVSTKAVVTVAVIAVAGILLFIGWSARNRDPHAVSRKDGAWPGDRSQAPTASTGATTRETPPETASTPEIPDGRRRMLALFSRRYPHFRDQFWRARRGGFAVLDLLADKEILQFAEWLETHPEAVQDFVGIARAAKSDVGTFALLLLAAGKHPGLEGFFSGLLASKESNAAESTLAAFGLSQIATSTALDQLAKVLNESLASGSLNYTYQVALGRTGGPGLDRLLQIAEEQIRLGRMTLDSLKMGTNHLRFSFDASIADRLRELAETHTSPAVRLLAALPLSVSPEHQAWVVKRLQEDPDPAVRQRIKDELCLRLLIGSKSGWAPEVKPFVDELLKSDYFKSPGARLRAGLNLDLEKYADAAREFVASGTREERGAILGEIATRNTPESTRLLQELALRSDFRDDEAHMLARAGTLTESRVADKLFAHLLLSNEGSKPNRTSDLIQALANFSDTDRGAHAVRLEREFPTASPSGRLAILEGIWRFGDVGERVLLKAARSQGDGVEQLAAWNALTSTGRFTEVLAREAKEFLTKRDPSTFGTPPEKWGSYLGGHYLNLIAQTYMAAGTPADIAMLEKMAANPRVPFTSHPEVIELFRSSVQTAIDAIRLRSAN